MLSNKNNITLYDQKNNQPNIVVLLSLSNYNQNSLVLKQPSQSLLEEVNQKEKRILCLSA